MIYLSAKDCAKLFGIKVNSWYRWIRCDSTAPKRAIRAPRYTRWNEDDVLAYQRLLME